MCGAEQQRGNGAKSVSAGTEGAGKQADSKKGRIRRKAEDFFQSRKAWKDLGGSKTISITKIAKKTFTLRDS